MFAFVNIMKLALVGKDLMLTPLRTMACRKKGAFRKPQRVPHLPIKGPRDYEYYRGLRRKPKNPKEKKNEHLHGRRPAIYKQKKKRDSPCESENEMND